MRDCRVPVVNRLYDFTETDVPHQVFQQILLCLFLLDRNVSFVKFALNASKAGTFEN